MTDKRHNNNVSPKQLFSKLPEGAIRVLQITDCHLYADTSNSLAGVNTEQSLLQLLNIAQEHILPVDLVLVTGDLIHDASPTGYQRLRDHLLTLNATTYCIPGNHDKHPVMEQNICCDGISTDTTSVHGDWAIIMLDSSIPGKVEGHLDEEQLERLKSGLESNRNRHVLVSMHHHPIHLGSAWIDKLALNNPDKLFSLLDQYDNVRGLLWGHAHQQYSGERNGVKLMGSPSTCIQFKPRQDDFAINPTPPGLRWLALLPDGSIETGIEFLEHTPPGIDLSVSGY